MSSFPSGLQGFWILLLRLVLAGSSAVVGAERLPFGSPTPLQVGSAAMAISGGVWVLASLSLAFGLITSRMLALAILVEIVAAVVRVGVGELHGGTVSELTAWITHLALAGSLMLTGPGAHSIDARRYGRQEVLIRSRGIAPHDARRK